MDDTCSFGANFCSAKTDLLISDEENEFPREILKVLTC